MVVGGGGSWWVWLLRPNLVSLPLSYKDAEAKATYVWMLGEYGEHFDEAPYLLEDQVEAYSDLQPSVKLQV